MTKNRIALVTGGGGGIGAAICKALAEDGLVVAVADLNLEAANRTAAALPGQGHKGFAADVASEESVKELFANVASALGPVAVLVNGAGIVLLKPDGSRKTVAETELSDWVSTEGVNARGTFLCCREFIHQMPADVPHQRVITISSVAAQLGGYRSSAAYIASKASILGLTKAVAREIAPARATANCVAPGLIDAPMLRQTLRPEDDHHAAAAIPLGRLGTADDVAACVRFLVSPAADYVTGATLDVNGGYLMQ